MVEPLTGDDPREVAGYQLRARLGAGGMGRVYLAFTPGGRPVAIKVIRAEFGDDEDFRDRFRQEVVAAQRVHGLYTAQVLDADPDAPRPWLATAYVPGLSLQQAVTDHGPLPPASVFLLIAGVAEALQAIHAAGIIHRDLKPSNVILASDGPRVIDFGIARAASAPALTRSGIRVGSAPFMAPEQARGEPTTPQVDVFSLGSLAAYAAAGRPPFGVGSAVAVLYRVLNGAPDLVSCPPVLRPLIERCLAKNPAQRPGPGDIIDICRAQTAGGALAFARSWLPSAVAAVAAGGAAAPRAPGSADPESRSSGGTADSTFPSERDVGAGQAGEGTESGELTDPRVGPPAGSAGLLVASVGQPGPAPSPGEPVVAAGLVGEPVVAAGPGAAPGTSAASQARPRRPRKAVLGWTAGVVVLVAVASVGIALLPGPALPGAGAAHRRGQAPAVRSPAATVSRAATHPAASAPGAPAASTTPGRPGPSSARQPPATTPPVPSTSAAAASSGRAAFGGTWDGTVSQPGWTVPSWTVELVIPATGKTGSYSAPSLGCSGTLRVPKTADTAMAAAATTTSAVNPGCVAKAKLTLTLSGSDQLSMTWTPTGHSHKQVGTAQLTGS